MFEPCVGDAVLPFRGQYLAMDWQNTEYKGEGSVQVRPKQGLVGYTQVQCTAHQYSETCL